MIISFIRHLEKNIYVMIENKYERIKWKTYTTDFEVDLHSIFGHVFNFIPDIHHVGCFFHYLKNIRNRLIQDWFTSNENIEHYDYLIAEVFKLPFKKNVNKTIDKDIDKLCKKNELYEDFNIYFKDTCCCYFKDKSLLLKDIDNIYSKIYFLKKLI